MDIKKYLNMPTYKRKLREWIINWLAPTEFEYSQSPFNIGDCIALVIRDSCFGEKGLCVRYSKHGLRWYRSGYFDQKSIYNLYDELYNIQPSYLLIIKEQNRNTEAIKKFIKEIKAICKDTEIEVKNNNGKVRMFN